MWKILVTGDISSERYTLAYYLVCRALLNATPFLTRNSMYPSNYGS